MRVLLVVSSARLAGTERHVVALAAGLRGAGIDAEVVCRPGGEGLDEVLRAHGIPVHPLPLAGRDIVVSTMKLARLARDFDVIHAHLTKAAVAAVGARLLTGRPLVETRHFVALAYETRSRGKRLLGTGLRAALRRGIDLTLAPSRAVLAKADGPAILVPHGLAPRATEHRSEGAGRFVTIGRIDEDRNYELVIRAFASVVRQGLSEASLTIVGRGPQRTRLEQVASALGVAAKVEFVDWMADPTSCLEASDVYLAAPFLPVPEAFGLSILEAMSLGLPVIAEPGGGASDLVEDGTTGRLVAAVVEEWASVMLELARDPARAAEMGQAARRRSEHQFALDAMIDKTIEAYRTLTDAPMGPRVLRIYQSAVVTEWRERDRQLRRRDFDVTTVSPLKGDEGGSLVHLERRADDFVVGAGTIGRHRMLIAYDPRPIWQQLRGHRFDIVDIHEEPASLAAAEVLLLTRLLSPTSKVVFYSAQNLEKRYPLPFRWSERWALSHADGLYACNREAAQIMRRKGCEGTIRVVPLGVDVGRFSPNGETSSTEHRGLRISYVGRLNRQKGVHVLLEAAALEPDWSLAIIGDGPDAASLKARAFDLGLGERARFLGNVAYGDLPGFYRASDVLVVPSLPTNNVLEQFCRVAVEAMASGVPVVASEIGALPAVVGSYGVLVCPGDAPALHDALAKLAADPVARRDLGMAARRWARRYDWSSVAESHAALYSDVLRTGDRTCVAPSGFPPGDP